MCVCVCVSAKICSCCDPAVCATRITTGSRSLLGSKSALRAFEGSRDQCLLFLKAKEDWLSPLRSPLAPIASHSAFLSKVWSALRGPAFLSDSWRPA